MRKVNKAGKIAFPAATAAVTVSTGTRFKAHADQLRSPDITTFTDYNKNSSFNQSAPPARMRLAGFQPVYPAQKRGAAADFVRF